MVVLGALCSLSFGALAHVRLGGMGIFDAFDFASSKILMPLAAILISLFVSTRWGKNAFIAANSNNGTLANAGLLRLVYWTLAVVSPVLIGVILVVGLL